ncbi:hypothetical protein CVT24_013115 [Panaeolus cyanescens]|uniref:Uncharacterized protein n=1 Tax=Panaeolus cyanescens TaxID=181874 RepID=A0A409YN57_9AGAR|nr:hypothetical protein CVT24_013115 [Panaeolus cyanescens]
MVNPGTFRGQRKTYLLSRKPDYEAAYDNSTQEDCIANIVQVYFRMFPPEMPLDYDPTDEEIEANLAKELVEQVEPHIDRLSASEYEQEMAVWNTRKQTIQTVKGQIKRWLAYQLLKDRNNLRKDLKGNDNPYASLVYQLSGNTLKKPRLRSAMSMWRRGEVHKTIEQVARARCLAENSPLKTNLAPTREKVAKALFDELGEGQKEAFARQAQVQYESELARWKESKNNPIPDDPQSYQHCISNLPAVVQPLLDLISQATGWKVTMLAGGPCPSRDGRMSMVSLHSGTTNGEIPMTFGKFESVRYRKYITPMFTNFLRNCYSVEECRRRTLGGDAADAGMPGYDDADGSGAAFEMLPENPAHAASSDAQTTNHGRTISAQSRSTSPSSDSSTSRAATPLNSPHHSRPMPSEQPVNDPSSPTSTSAASTPRRPNLTPPAMSPNSPIRSPAVSPVSLRTVAVTPPPISPRAAITPLVPSLGPIAVVQATNTRSKKRRPIEEANLEALPRKSSRLDKPSGVGVMVNGSNRNARREPATAAQVPDWFTGCMRMFTEGSTGIGVDKNGSLGDDWVRLVDAWSVFQRKAGFEEDRRLPTKNRPTVIKDWIARARNPLYRPDIRNIGEYEASFDAWWSSMQPDWRLERGKVNRDLVDGDWSDLRLPGLNGLVSVVAALFYWGLAVNGNKTRTVAWQKSVRDCTTALQHL